MLVKLGPLPSCAITTPAVTPIAPLAPLPFTAPAISTSSLAQLIGADPAMRTIRNPWTGMRVHAAPARRLPEPFRKLPSRDIASPSSTRSTVEPATRTEKPLSEREAAILANAVSRVPRLRAFFREGRFTPQQQYRLANRLLQTANMEATMTALTEEMAMQAREIAEHERCPTYLCDMFLAVIAMQPARVAMPTATPTRFGTPEQASMYRRAVNARKLGRPLHRDQFRAYVLRGDPDDIKKRDAAHYPEFLHALPTALQETVAEIERASITALTAQQAECLARAESVPQTADQFTNEAWYAYVMRGNPAHRSKKNNATYAEFKKALPSPYLLRLEAAEKKWLKGMTDCMEHRFERTRIAAHLKMRMSKEEWQTYFMTGSRTRPPHSRVDYRSKYRAVMAHFRPEDRATLGAWEREIIIVSPCTTPQDQLYRALHWKQAGRIFHRQQYWAYVLRGEPDVMKSSDYEHFCDFVVHIPPKAKLAVKTAEALAITELTPMEAARVARAETPFEGTTQLTNEAWYAYVLENRPGLVTNPANVTKVYALFKDALPPQGRQRLEAAEQRFLRGMTQRMQEWLDRARDAARSGRKMAEGAWHSYVTGYKKWPGHYFRTYAASLPTHERGLLMQYTAMVTGRGKQRRA